MLLTLLPGAVEAADWTRPDRVAGRGELAARLAPPALGRRVARSTSFTRASVAGQTDDRVLYQRSVRRRHDAGAGRGPSSRPAGGIARSRPTWRWPPRRTWWPRPGGRRARPVPAVGACQSRRRPQLRQHATSCSRPGRSVASACPPWRSSRAGSSRSPGPTAATGASWCASAATAAVTSAGRSRLGRDAACPSTAGPATTDGLVGLAASRQRLYAAWSDGARGTVPGQQHRDAQHGRRCSHLGAAGHAHRPAQLRLARARCTRPPRRGDRPVDHRRHHRGPLRATTGRTGGTGSSTTRKGRNLSAADVVLLPKGRAMVTYVDERLRRSRLREHAGRVALEPR